jgi:integrase/recombinase XerD
MLSDFFTARWRIRALRDGPGGALVNGFAEALSHMRYAAITGRRHLRAAEHFLDWADRNGLSLSNWSGQALARFGRHLVRCRCAFAHANRADALNGARIFLTYLRDAQRIPASALDDTVQDPALLSTFEQSPTHAGDLQHRRQRRDRR